MKTLQLQGALFIAIILSVTACKKENITASAAITDQTTIDASLQVADAKTIYLNSTISGNPQLQSIDIAGKIVNWTFEPNYVNPQHMYLDYFDVVPLAINDTLIYGGANVFKINKNTGAVTDSFKYVEYNDYVEEIYYNNSVGYFNARKRIVYIADNMLICKDAAGNTLWQKPPTLSYGSAPVIKNNNLLVTDYRRIVCLNPLNGAQRWHYAALNPLRLNALCVAGDTVFAVDEAANIYAINTVSGALVWQKQYGNTTGGGYGGAAQIAWYNGNIFLVSSGFLRCINAATGDELWHTADGIFSQNNFCISKGKVFIAGYTTSGDSFSSMFAFNASTGAVLWQNSDHSYQGMAPVETGGTVYCSYLRNTGGPSESGLAGININTGETKWMYVVHAYAHSLTLETLQGQIVYPVTSGEIN